MDNPYLSICIPTYNRLEILRNTLNSIYSDLNDVNMDDFEVVISDNSPDSSTRGIKEKFNYPNLHYVETKCDGFLNSYFAMTYGKGKYLKLHNNYAKLQKGTLKNLIDAIKNNMDEKPFFFFTNGEKLKGRVINYFSFDEFMAGLSYYSSWSTGFGMWRSDFEKYKRIELDSMFPQTSLILTQIYKKKYILNDCKLFEDQYIPKKGGYNIFKVFSVGYIRLIKTSFDNGYISKKTFELIKKDLLYKYISVRYFKTVIFKLDTFDKDDIKKNISVYYSCLEYYLMIIISLFTPLRVIIRKIMRYFK